MKLTTWGPTPTTTRGTEHRRASFSPVYSIFALLHQVGDDDSWEYSVDEADHMGTNRHHYQGHRTPEGFILSRQHQSGDKINREHARVGRFNSSQSDDYINRA